MFFVDKKFTEKTPADHGMRVGYQRHPVLLLLLVLLVLVLLSLRQD